MHSLWVHLPFPLGDVLLAQFRPGPCTVMHIRVLLWGSLQAGLRNPRGGENHLIFVFLWSVAMTPPSLLIPYGWLACFPWRCGALVHPLTHTNNEPSLLGNQKKGAKHKPSMRAGTAIVLVHAASSLQKASPPRPFPLPTDHNRMRIRTALQLMLIQLSWLKAQKEGGNKG